MADEKRTLEIAARVRDFASSTMRRIAKTGRNLGRALVAPFTAAFRAVTSLRGAMVALLAVFAVSRIKAFIDTLRQGLDQFAKVSDQLGVTAESLTAVEFAAGQAGVKFEELRVGLTQFERNVENARRGARNQQEALSRLGITVEELRGEQLDLVDVLGRVGDGLEGIQSQTERADALLNLFGESGLKLAPLLNQGSEGIRRLAAEAERLGIVFSREELARVERFNDTIDSLTRSVVSLAQRILLEVAPVLTDALTLLKDNITADGESVRRALFTIAASIVEVFESVALFALDVVKAIGDVANFAERAFLQIKSGAVALQQAFADLFGSDREARELRQQVVDLQVEVIKLESASRQSAREFERRAQAVREFFAKAREEIRKSREEQEQQETPTRAGRVEVTSDAPNLLEQIREGAIAAAKPLKDLGQVAFQAGRQLTTSFQAATESLFTDLITGTRKARDAFKQFATAVLRSIAQIISKIAAAAVVRALFSSFFPGSFESGGVQPGNLESIVELARGGIMRGRRAARAFQDGGIARAPTVALFGEGDQAEAFVPLPDNRTIPVTLTREDSGPRVLQFFISAMDGRDVRRVLIENQSTLKSIYSNGLETNRAHRNVVQRVTQ